MSKILKSILLGTALTAATATVSKAEGVELEVTHWWTSGGEAAAVGKFADAWNATGNTWVDGASLMFEGLRHKVRGDDKEHI